jgi:copper(I)-binding protein
MLMPHYGHMTDADLPHIISGACYIAPGRNERDVSMNSKRLGILTTLMLAAACAAAQTEVKQPWVRATVAQQKATGAFMQIRSPQDARLVEVRSDVAEVAELHEMVMEGNVMKMRAVAGVDLPAGKSVELKPGGYHVMLLELKRQLSAGDSVALTLVIEGRDGNRQSVAVQAAVRALNTPAGAEHKH